MLFKSIDELKEITGFLYAYNNFENIKTDIELAEEDIRDLIGLPTYEAIHEYYNDDGATQTDFMDKLVKHVQLPVAYHAIHTFSQNADISHEDSGRKVKIDSEREKLPWQWMLERDERAVLRKAHRTTDRLIAFLEANINESALLDWKNSDERKAIREQFISDAKTFDSIYPIDNSRRFFLKIAPFIREAERKFILPVLTREIFDSIKTSLSESSQATIEPLGILPLIQVPLAYYALSIAVERLNISILPDAVVQFYDSDKHTKSANQNVSLDAKFNFVVQLKERAQAELSILQEFLRKSNEGEDYQEPDLTRGLNESYKHARV